MDLFLISTFADLSAKTSSLSLNTECVTRYHFNKVSAVMIFFAQIYFAPSKEI